MDLIRKSSTVKISWKATLFSGITIFALMETMLFAIPGARAAGTVITVNTTNNELNSDGDCSFREAIQAANTNSAVDACSAGSSTPGDVDTIAFGISGTGLHTITVTNVIQVTAPVHIDGSTQSGYAAIPLIEITGTVEDLLRFGPDADGSTLQALRLTNTNSGGLTDGGTALFYSDNNHIIGNYFNTDGNSVVGAHGAGLIFDTSSGNVIGGITPAERNLFGGQAGIYFHDTSNSLIQRNYFGVRADGNTALSGLPEDGNGIQIYNVSGSSSNNTVRGNVITGYLAGVQLFQGASSNIIAGNNIGLGANGTTLLPNGIGVYINGAPNNTVGGNTAADRNVISGSTAGNIRLENGSNNNVIRGNYIGTDARGQSVFTPNGYGVYAAGGTGNLFYSNLISDNVIGIYMSGSSSAASGSSQNCIAGNSSYGIQNVAGAPNEPFSNNWWGSPDGPSPAGHGDSVSTNVTYSPYLISPPATCTTGGPVTISDFDGDGKSDPAKFDASTNTLSYLASSTATWQDVDMGAGTIAYVPRSDFDGDGKTDPAMFVPSANALWYLEFEHEYLAGGLHGTGQLHVCGGLGL